MLLLIIYTKKLAGASLLGVVLLNTEVLQHQYSIPPKNHQIGGLMGLVRPGQIFGNSIIAHAKHSMQRHGKIIRSLRRRLGPLPYRPDF